MAAVAAFFSSIFPQRCLPDAALNLGFGIERTDKNARTKRAFF
jgi:hypothetical protein